MIADSKFWKKLWETLGIATAVVLTIFLKDWRWIVAVWIVYVCVANFWEDSQESLADEDKTQNKRTAEDRLDELERLKRRDMVTPEEYAAKRQEILKDL